MLKEQNNKTSDSFDNVKDMMRDNLTQIALIIDSNKKQERHLEKIKDDQEKNLGKTQSSINNLSSKVSELGIYLDTVMKTLERYVIRDIDKGGGNNA